MDFGTKLRILRNEKGISQSELMSRTGINKVIISYYENNHRKPRTEHLKMIALTFNVTTDYLLGLGPRQPIAKG